MELVEFLLARIDADERLARSAAGDESGSWHDTVEETGDGENAYYAVADDDHMAEDYGYFADLRGVRPNGSRAAHIARWDPARVLAECAAKRAIVEYFERKRPEFWGEIRMAQLRALALPYADHHDYDTRWNPEATQ